MIGLRIGRCYALRILGLSVCCLIAPQTAETQRLAQTNATGQPIRWLVLGRVINLTSLRREASLTDSPPEEELSDPGSDFGAVVTPRGDLSAYRLSTKERLWTKSASPRCGRLVLAEAYLYAECDGGLRAFATADGTSTVLEARQDVDQILVRGTYLAAHHRTALVTVFDLVGNRVVAKKILPELTDAPGGGELIASPAVEGWCVRGFSRSRTHSHQWSFRLGCYDRRLKRLWSKSVSFDLPPEPERTLSEPLFAIRQQGPCYFVANDQPFTYADRGRGKGLLVRWTNGDVETFDDHTFATIDGPGCERLKAPEALKVFTGPIKRDPRQEDFRIAEAVMASDEKRAFALVMNDASRLAGIDLRTERVLFVTALPLGAAGQTLEIVGGFPVVRTRFLGTAGQYWRASVHDPETGRLLYEDERPASAPSRMPSQD